MLCYRKTAVRKMKKQKKTVVIAQKTELQRKPEAISVCLQSKMSTNGDFHHK